MTMSTAATTTTDRSVRVPLHRRFAYASTDAAGNLLYTTVSTFILYYYTDVFGLSVAAAGTILLAARILDAFDARSGASSSTTPGPAGDSPARTGCGWRCRSRSSS